MGMRGQGDWILLCCHSIFMYRWELSNREQKASDMGERGANRRTKQEDGMQCVVEGLVLGMGSVPPVLRGRLTDCKCTGAWSCQEESSLVGFTFLEKYSAEIEEVL